MSGMSNNTSTSPWRRDWGLHEPWKIEFTPKQRTSESVINPYKFIQQGSRGVRFKIRGLRSEGRGCLRLQPDDLTLANFYFRLEKFILRTDCDRARFLPWILISPTGLNRTAIILVSSMIIQAIGPRVPIWRILRNISKTFSGEVIPGIRKVAELDIVWND